MILSLQQAALGKHWSRIETVACKTLNSSDKVKESEGKWMYKAKAGKFIGTGMLHSCTSDQLKHAAETCRPAGKVSRGMQEVLCMAASFVVTYENLGYRFFSCLILWWWQTPTQQSATFSACQWDLHIYKCFVELGPTTLMISVCENQIVGCNRLMNQTPESWY